MKINVSHQLMVLNSSYIDLIGQSHIVIGHMSVKPWCYIGDQDSVCDWLLTSQAIVWFT